MNPARQILHILGKDIRGHALEIGLVLLLNGALTWTLTRTWGEGVAVGDQLIGAAAQLLLVVAWCALIGRVVQGDGIAGKAPYWLTRPYRRPALLSSKLAFVLLFVHLPLFLSHLVIVTGSGLPLSVTQMLVDQAVLAAVVSLPLMVLAALTTSFIRFAFVGIAVAAVALSVHTEANRSDISYAFWVSRQFANSDFFVAAGLVSLAAIAGAALVCQYRWRATLRVAVSSAFALCLLGLGMLSLSARFVLRAKSVLSSPQTIASTIRLRDPSARLVSGQSDLTDPLSVSLPIEMTIADDASIVYTKFDVRSPTGRKVELVHYVYTPNTWRALGDGTRWLDLRMSRSDYESLKDSAVSIRLIVEIETYETLELEPIPRDLSAVIVGGRAQCGIPDGRAPFTCRTSFGWSTWNFIPQLGDTGTAVYELSLPVRLRFAINPIVTQRGGSREVATALRRRVSYTRQDVTFENIRLGDWGP